MDNRRECRYEGPAMRGFLQPSFRHDPSETQLAFQTLSRHRRVHIAEAAKTTLVKASQWAAGRAIAPAVAEALEQQVKAQLAKKKA